MAVTLDWQNILALVSTGLAFDGYRRAYRQARARAEGRRRTMRLVAASAFRNLEHDAYEIEISLAKGDWERASGQVGRVRLALAEAAGTCAEFLVGPDGDKAQAAGSQLAALQATLQALGPALPRNEDRLAMAGQCATAYTLVAELAGRLTYLDEQVPDAWIRLRHRLGRIGRRGT